MQIAANTIRLNVMDTGAGPSTLVFMHYFGGSLLEWQGVINQLAGQYRCVAIDLRGHGDSDAPASNYAVDDMADDVAGLIEALNLTRFVLVAHSMSGKVALALAARQMAGLKMLLLVSPSPPLPEPIPDDDRQKLLNGYGDRLAAEQTLKTITARAVSESAGQQIVADNLRTAKPAWDAWLLAGSKEDISDRMAAVSVPVHIIVGADDRALAPDVQPRMVLPYLPAATLTTCVGAGHLLPWEVPDELVAFIEKKLPHNFHKLL